MFKKNVVIDEWGFIVSSKDIEPGFYCVTYPTKGLVVLSSMDKTVKIEGITFGQICMLVNYLSNGSILGGKVDRDASVALLSSKCSFDDISRDDLGKLFSMYVSRYCMLKGFSFIEVKKAIESEDLLALSGFGVSVYKVTPYEYLVRCIGTGEKIRGIRCGSKHLVEAVCKSMK